MIKACRRLFAIHEGAMLWPPAANWHFCSSTTAHNCPSSTDERVSGSAIIQRDSARLRNQISGRAGDLRYTGCRSRLRSLRQQSKSHTRKASTCDRVRGLAHRMDKKSEPQGGDEKSLQGPAPLRRVTWVD